MEFFRKRAIERNEPLRDTSKAVPEVLAMLDNIQKEWPGSHTNYNKININLFGGATLDYETGLYVLRRNYSLGWGVEQHIAIAKSPEGVMGLLKAAEKRLMRAPASKRDAVSDLGKRWHNEPETAFINCERARENK